MSLLYPPGVNTRIFWFPFQIVLVTIVAVLAIQKVDAMSLIKGEKVCVFSGFDLTITHNGKPAEGARVVRQWVWKDQREERDEAIADAHGRVQFAAQWDTLRQLFPSQFVSYQTIVVYFEGEKFEIWSAGKMNTGEFSEFGGEPVNVHCELTDDFRRVEAKNLDSEVVGTNCHWEIKGE